MKMGKSLLKEYSGSKNMGSGQHGGGMGAYGGHGGYGGNTGYGGHGGYQGGYQDKEAMRQAMKMAQTQDPKSMDPQVLNYAATKLQAGFRGYMTRKNMNH